MRALLLFVTLSLSLSTACAPEEVEAVESDVSTDEPWCGEEGQECCPCTRPFCRYYTCNSEDLRCAAVVYPPPLEGPSRLCLPRD